MKIDASSGELACCCIEVLVALRRVGRGYGELNLAMTLVLVE